jgi:hypothetical protein
LLAPSCSGHEFHKELTGANSIQYSEGQQLHLFWVELSTMRLTKWTNNPFNFKVSNLQWGKTMVSAIARCHRASWAAVAMILAPELEPWFDYTFICWSFIPLGTKCVLKHPQIMGSHFKLP